MAQPAPAHSPTIIGPDRAAEYLAQMGIEVADINVAIEAGEIMAGNITTHHPITAAGLTRWIHVVGRLRELLAGSGQWSPDNPRNRPISKRNDARYTLSTVGGDEGTGIADHPTGPAAARKKGKATAEAVNGMDSLIRIETLRPSPDNGDGTAPPNGNWFLVYHRSEGSVRLEVSLPLGFDEDEGQFTGWRVRVILPDWRPKEINEKKPLDVGGQDVDFQIFEAS